MTTSQRSAIIMANKIQKIRAWMFPYPESTVTGNFWVVMT
jgi:hypothetical protein